MSSSPKEKFGVKRNSLHLYSSSFHVHLYSTKVLFASDRIVPVA
ncbi:hypothetical protein GXM_09510 [Nostoc sphaeroides CCNUC1]|uniref:Uncharacterized protein n=1 Tax=Nostoc sphaeroides CCNUC1 TaxID=2653204 RepID=A0A5P8WIZ9_9NOSO|nr:hypothetical protein GXM_09293 [Nostoc sphaeroides CCNUC1]QFS52016.1 hypothetical protein GXM_09510 [Nostoc sphaeroides CCNUC1]